MKKIGVALCLLIAFTLGYGFRGLTQSEKLGPRATSIGGIFFKAKDPKALKQWYADYLGMRMVESGTNFEWRQGADSTKKGFTLWAPFKETTTYFDKQFMINYRVEGLDALLAKMKQHGILPADSVERSSYGSFVHVIDPEGNKIELWEADDVGYAKLGGNTMK